MSPSLSESFDEFTAPDVECRSCGDQVRPQFAVDGECVGCRYGGRR